MQEQFTIEIIPQPQPLVKFGAYKNKPIEALLADQDYCRHLVLQPKFRQTMEEYTALILNRYPQLSATTDHNKLCKHLLLDKCLQIRTLRKLGVSLNGKSTIRPTSEFSKACIDIHYEVGYSYNCTVESRTKWRQTGSAALEVKPYIGDDYVDVLAQCKKKRRSVQGKIGGVWAVYCRYLEVTDHTEPEVRAVFNRSNIELIVDRVPLRKGSLIPSDNFDLGV